MQPEPISDGTWTTTRTAAGTPLATKSATSSALLTTNSHSDVAATVDPATGALTSSQTYNPFGQQATTAGTPPSTGFQSSWTDPTSGLVHAQARWYDPTTGTFLSEDPAPPEATSAGTTNLYSYGAANPTSRIDPEGTFSWGSVWHEISDIGKHLENIGKDIERAAGNVVRTSERVGTIIGREAGSAAGELEGAEEVAASDVLTGIGVAGDAIACAAVCELVAAGMIIIGAIYLGYGAYRLLTTKSDNVYGNPYRGGGRSAGGRSSGGRSSGGRGADGGSAGGGGGGRVSAPSAATRVDAPAPRVVKPPPPYVTGTRTTFTSRWWRTVTKYWDDTYSYTRTDTYSYTTTYRYTYWSNGRTDTAGPFRSPTTDTVRITKQLLIDLNRIAFPTIHFANTRPVQPDQPDPATPNNGTCGAGGPTSTCASNGQQPLPPGAPDSASGGDRAPPNGGQPAATGSCDPSGGDADAVPHGFSSSNEFHNFSAQLRAGLAEAGYCDTDAVFQGSSVTGRSFKTGEQFDAGRTSDFDVALGGEDIFSSARAAGVGLRGGGARTGPLGVRDLARLGLSDLQAALSDAAGRPVNFMIYRSVGDAFARGPGILAP